MLTMKEIRHRCGLTRHAFAEKMGIALQTLKAYECDMIPIPPERIKRAREILQQVKQI